MTGRHMCCRGALGALFFTGLALLFGLIVKLLWNALIPSLFSGPFVSYWQALGLLLLSHILLRGHAHGFHAFKWRHSNWRDDFDRKLAELPVEERERFRRNWSPCCDYHSKASDTKTESGSK